MKVKSFTYTSKNSEEAKKHLVLILNESEKYVEGIDFVDMEQEIVEKITKIQIEYEKKLKPYMEKYRKFIKEKITIT